MCAVMSTFDAQDQEPSLDNCGQLKVKWGWWPGLGRHTHGIHLNYLLSRPRRPKSGRGGWESTMCTGQGGGKEDFSGREREIQGRGGSVILGWLTQSRLTPDKYNLCIETQNPTGQMSKLRFFLKTFKIFYINRRKSLLCGIALLKH